MLHHTKLFLVLSLFSRLNLYSAQEANNTPSITSKVFEYLKSKEVPYNLKNELNKIFYLPQVMEEISKIYTVNACLNKKKLIEQGFIFPDLGTKRIFQHTSFPNLIFKIGFANTYRHTELCNAGRIRYAELINQRKNPCLKAPIKYAYMPYLFKSEGISLPVCFNCLPICIVVSEFIKCDEKNEPGLLNDNDYNKFISLLKSINYADGNRCNVFKFADYFMVIDTEPHRVQLEYPEIS